MPLATFLTAHDVRLLASAFMTSLMVCAVALWIMPRRPVRLPLLRKIASSVGIAEIVLLNRDEDGWLPVAVGEWSLQAIARAEAWLAVPGGSEGFAAGAAVDAYMVRD